MIAYLIHAVMFIYGNAERLSLYSTDLMTRGVPVRVLQEIVSEYDSTSFYPMWWRIGHCLVAGLPLAL
jgi:hypothetical protein